MLFGIFIPFSLLTLNVVSQERRKEAERMAREREELRRQQEQLRYEQEKRNSLKRGREMEHGYAHFTTLSVTGLYLDFFFFFAVTCQ